MENTENEVAPLIISDETQSAKNLVLELLAFIDNYYHDKEFSVENARQKDIDVDSLIKQTISKIDALKIPASEIGMKYLLTGKCLNAKNEFNEESLRLLTKASKLYPKLGDAWSELGKCKWARGDNAGAYSCFKSAANYTGCATDSASVGGGAPVDKTIMRNLSVATRNLPTDNAEQRRDNLLESNRIAKDAIKADVNDGRSWEVLAAGFFIMFCHNLANVQYLRQAKAAYSKALQCPIARADSNLHFCYSKIMKFETNFDAVLIECITAYKLEPGWELISQRLLEFVRYLDCLVDMLRSSGQLKKKRLINLIDSLNRADTKLHLIHNHHSTSPSSNNTAVSSSSSEASPSTQQPMSVESGQTRHSLELVWIHELKPGLNEHKMVLGCIIGSVPEGESLSQTFILMDRIPETHTQNGSANNSAAAPVSGDTHTHADTHAHEWAGIPVRIFNLGSNKGPAIGDSILIPEPYLEVIQISDSTLCSTFECVQNIASSSSQSCEAAPPKVAASTNTAAAATATHPVKSSNRGAPSPSSVKQLSQFSEKHPFRMNFLRVTTPSLLVVNGKKVGDKWTAAPIVGYWLKN